MELTAFRQAFSFETWFETWWGVLTSAPASSGDWPVSVRRLVLEALSDASAEQFLNPLAASHLRHFGSALAQNIPERTFWVRSEWEKVDISYGFAKKFEPSTQGWNRAWVEGDTGDLGQCEVKVCYAHQYRGKMDVLHQQLTERRNRDVGRNAHDREHLRYHGLVWLFDNGDLGKLHEVGGKLQDEAESLGLKVVRPFNEYMIRDELGNLWPAADGKKYACGMSLALIELSSAAS